MYSLENLEKFARLLHDVQRVKRVSRRPDEQERTNTAEHTFSVALMGWYIAQLHAPELDQEKVLKYALAHDIVEAYAGDTFAYDEEAKKTKAAREAAALERITSEFPEFSDLVEVIHEYEARQTPEAKFVYAVDKLVDPFDVSMETTQSLWKETQVSLTTLIDHKTEKIALSTAVLPYWELLVEKLKKNKEFFFGE